MKFTEACVDKIHLQIGYIRLKKVEILFKTKTGL